LRPLFLEKLIKDNEDNPLIKKAIEFGQRHQSAGFGRMPLGSSRATALRRECENAFGIANGFQLTGFDCGR